MFPTFALPDTLNVPVTFAPEPVTTKTFAFPATLEVILPLGFTTKLLVPLTIEVPAVI